MCACARELIRSYPSPLSQTASVAVAIISFFFFPFFKLFAVSGTVVTTLQIHSLSHLLAWKFGKTISVSSLEKFYSFSGEIK